MTSTAKHLTKKMAQDDVHMADRTNDIEIKMNLPKPFTGKKDELKRFLQNCRIHLQINRKKYDTDFAKIEFVLALMDEEYAATWKELMMDQMTYVNFEKALQESFEPYDVDKDASAQIEQMKMVTRRTYEITEEQKNDGRRKDPYTIDIDEMSTMKQERLMKAGRCFYCEEHGHLAKECPKKRRTKGKQAERKDEPPRHDGPLKKWKTGKELYTHIRSLAAELNEDEHEKFMKEVEGPDF